MKILYRYLLEYKWILFLAITLATVNTFFSLLDPYVFRRITDDYLTKIPFLRNHEHYTTYKILWGIGKWVLVGITVAMISRIAKNFQDYFTNVVTQKIGVNIYTDGLSHSLKLPYIVFEDQRSGETLGILTKLRTDVQQLILLVVSVLFTSLISVIFVSIYAFSIYWLITVFYIATIPTLGFVSWLLSSNIKKIQKTIVSETTALAGSTTESLRNIELVKSSGLADEEIQRLNGITGKILKLELKMVRYVRSLSFVQGTVVNFLRNCILFLLAFLVIAGKIKLGEMFSLFFYSFAIFNPLQELGNIIGVYRLTEASLDNYAKILARPIEEKPINPVHLENIENLAFQNVGFKHQSGIRNALTNISFEVAKGETIAFVGPSGAGKTTLVKLLVGLYHPLNGNILYDGVDSAQLDLEKLQKRIGFVTQDTQLFAGTIRENLLFVKPMATDEECMTVLRKAACISLLERANNGLDSVIGEGGVKVSGGEKQRLSIARALLRNPEIMIFDEATSSLDSITEEEINSTIRHVSQTHNQITIMIAHRLSTIMHSDKIFVLERGKIIEMGKHEDLVALKGLYYAMWRQQIGEKEMDSEFNFASITN